VSGEPGGDLARAELYRRLPLLDGDRWWVELARSSPDGRVLELGAGTGRLTAALLDAGLTVTAVERDPGMLAVLRERVGDAATVVAADAVDLPAMDPFGRVVLPTSLLNELPDAATRRRVLEGASDRCRRDGRVALHLLGPWWLATLPPRSAGRLQPADGASTVEVTVIDEGFDAWTGRRRARLRYRFGDGTHLQDRLDAAVVTGAELELALATAGLEVEQRYGVAPPDDEPGPGPAWHLVCRPTLTRPVPRSRPASGRR
jgi:SAM-dependent methyltransferase